MTRSRQRTERWAIMTFVLVWTRLVLRHQSVWNPLKGEFGVVNVEQTLGARENEMRSSVFLNSLRPIICSLVSQGSQ